MKRRKAKENERKRKRRLRDNKMKGNMRTYGNWTRKDGEKTRKKG